MAEVGCAGILVADTFCGPMAALPAEGQLLAVDDMPSRAGGCAANVAIGLAKQGVAVDVLGCVGRDAAAGIVVSELEAHGVGCDAIIRVPEHPTSKTVILLVAGQDRRYIHTFGANAALTVGHIPHDWLAGLRVFYLGGLFLMPAFRPAELVPLLAFCRDHGIVTVVDVVVPQQVQGMAELAPLLPLIDFFLPNADEAYALTGEREPIDQVRAFLAAGARTAIVTCGASGCLAAGGAECWQVGAFPMPVVDPSGPGDAFDAGLITGILRGWALPQTLTYATALGASAVRAVGTTPGIFTAEEAEGFLTAHRLDITRVAL